MLPFQSEDFLLNIIMYYFIPHPQPTKEYRFKKLHTFLIFDGMLIESFE